MSKKPEKSPMNTYLTPAVYRRPVQYDYTNQAWIIDGVYRRCGHPERMGCQCFGKLHEGEKPQEGAWISPWTK